MCRMAVAARCGDSEAALQQSFPVDTLRVVGDDLMLRSGVPNCRFLPFLMAFAAKHRDIDGEDGGFWIRPALHFVSAVTFLAGGCIRIVVGDQSPVHTTLKLLPDLRVTGCAVDLLYYCLTRPVPRRVHPGMALAAGNLLMH